ncbi:MAG: UDP-N-acetylglucosamine 2-epimerase (non-hydrolyzing) [Gammaproteobacteria bacterium]|nr:UDP-N-acetylglucosamine 2-epimerase (non-hydrolyzing) [Gammaproteobacteria bacterium]
MPRKVLKTIVVAGARPNFVKIAPLMKEIKKRKFEIEALLVHTGQHFDQSMSQSFFEDLSIPEPMVNLGVGGGSHAQQTAQIMIRFEPVLLEQAPDIVIVVGDVNSTLACTLVAAKLGFKVAHIEAGLRSFDSTMPEELNRLVTDQLSNLLFVTEKSAIQNLDREGIATEKVFFVGNVMADTLLTHKERTIGSNLFEKLDLTKGAYALVTMHRPSNVDDSSVLSDLVGVLCEISRKLPVVFPIHPRTRSKLSDAGLLEVIESNIAIRVLEPLGYLGFLTLSSNARMLLTDSGGLQEEACILEVPCITLRENTERPITVESGWSVLTGANSERILLAVERVLAGEIQGVDIPLWDGKAAGRIIDTLIKTLNAN